jgi:hypothetical protein
MGGDAAVTEWKDDLKRFYEERSCGTKTAKADAAIRAEVGKFYGSRVKPAFKELRKELGRYGREVAVDVGDDHASIDVRYEGRLELSYRIVVRGTRPHPESYYQVPSGGGLRSEGAFKTGARPAEMADLSKEDIVADFLREYRSAMAAVKT